MRNRTPALRRRSMHVGSAAGLRVGFDRARTAVSAVSAISTVSAVPPVSAIPTIPAQPVRAAVRAAVSRKGRGASTIQLELPIVRQQPEKLKFAALVEQPILEQYSVGIEQ